MSQDTCLLLKSRGIQFDRGKNYVKKNCAIWFGIAQMRKCNKQINKNETNLQKNRLKDFEKLIDRRVKKSLSHDNFN